MEQENENPSYILREQHEGNNATTRRVVPALTLIGQTAGLSVAGRPPFGLGIAGAYSAYAAWIHLNERNNQVVPDLRERMQHKCDDIVFVNELRDDSWSSRQAIEEFTGRLLDVDDKPWPAVVMTAGSSASNKVLSMVSGALGIPTMSSIAIDTKLDHESNYPLYSRTVSTLRGEVLAVVAYLQHLGVTHIGLIYIGGANFGASYFQVLQEEAAKVDIQVKGAPYTYGDDVDKSVQEAINVMKGTGYKYFLALPEGQVAFYKDLAVEAYRQGLVGPDYFWLMDDHLLNFMSSPYINITEDPEWAEAVQGMAFYQEAVPPNQAFNDAFLHAVTNDTLRQGFIDQVNNRDWLDQFNLTQSLPIYTHFNQFIYDGTIALGLAVCEAANKTDQPTGEQIYEEIKHLKPFQGATGLVEFDPNTGTRKPGYAPFKVWNFQRHDHTNSSWRDGDIITVDAQHTTLIQPNNEPPVQILQPFVYFDGTTQQPLVAEALVHNYNLIPSWIQITSWCLAGLTMLISCLIAGLIYNYRRKPIMEVSQPPFMYLTCLGTFLMGASLVPLPLQDQGNISTNALDVACQIPLWTFSFGFVCAYSSVFCKMWRLNKIMKSAQSFQRIKVEAKDVIYPFVILLALSGIVLSVWTAVDPLLWVRTDSATNLDPFGRPKESKGRCQCQSTTNEAIFYGLYFAVNIGALLFANYQSYKARNVKVRFNESTLVATAMAALLEVFLVGLPVTIVVYRDPTKFVLIRSIVVSCMALSLLLPLFLPKFVQFGRKDTTVFSEEANKRGSTWFFRPTSTDNTGGLGSSLGHTGSGPIAYHHRLQQPSDRFIGNRGSTSNDTSGVALGLSSNTNGTGDGDMERRNASDGV